MKETINKVLIKTYVTYGKGRGRELLYYDVFDKNDTEKIKNYYDQVVGEDVYGDFDSLLKGETVRWKYYGDWDDPTGGEMCLVSYEQEAKSILDGFNAQMKELNRAFGIKI